MAAWLLPLAKPSCALLSSVAARALLPGSLPHAATAVCRTDHSSCNCPRCRGCSPRCGSATTTTAQATPGTSGPAMQAGGSAISSLRPAVGSVAASSICTGVRFWAHPNAYSVRSFEAPAAAAAATSARAPAAAAPASAAVGQAAGIHAGAAQAAQVTCAHDGLLTVLAIGRCRHRSEQPVTAHACRRHAFCRIWST